MKLIALTAAAALTVSTAAYADHHMQTDDGLIPLGNSPQTETYDGPNSRGAPGQPAPTDSEAKTESVFATYQASTRADYPFCSATVRDNCRQRRDPGY